MTYVVILTVTSSSACSGSDVSVLGECGCSNGASLVVLSCEVMDGRRSLPCSRESTGLLFDSNCICKIRNRNFIYIT